MNYVIDEKKIPVLLQMDAISYLLMCLEQRVADGEFGKSCLDLFQDKLFYVEYRLEKLQEQISNKRV